MTITPTDQQADSVYTGGSLSDAYTGSWPVDDDTDDDVAALTVVGQWPLVIEPLVFTDVRRASVFVPHRSAPRVVRPRPRSVRPRARASRSSSRATRAGPGGDDSGSDPEPSPGVAPDGTFQVAAGTRAQGGLRHVSVVLADWLDGLHARAAG